MSTSQRSLAVRIAAISGAVGIGMLSVVQSRINGELGLEIGGFLAAVISFGSGLVLLGFAMLASRRGRVGLGRVRDALRAGSVPWWMVLGGAGGAFFVLTQSLTAGLLGVALFTISVVGGQVVSALLVDRRGIGAAVPQHPTGFRIAGAVLALVAVGWAVSAPVETSVPLWMLILPVIAGAGIAWQQAVNGQVRLTADSALTATFGNFVVGTTLLAVVALVATPFTGWPESFPANPLLYVGGIIGVVFIAGASVIVRGTGVLVLGLATICGQLIMSVALDLLVPVPGHELALSTVGGTVLALAAVAIASIRPRRSTASPVTESSGSPSD
jgi:bacterial/archaeal transporter family-2 protein